MGLHGANLAEVWRKAEAEAPVSGAARRISEHAGDRLVGAVKENTPIDTWMHDLERPEHLRDSIRRKELVVEPHADGDVYATGAETDVEYAPYVEFPTGTFAGKGPYKIRPKRPGGWLSWITRTGFTRRDGTVVAPGTRVFAREVLHPGSPGNYMFALGGVRAEEDFPEIARPHLERWTRQIERAM